MITIETAKDLMGREIHVGDIIAYGILISRSANMAIYRVEEIVLREQIGYHEGPPGETWGLFIGPKLIVTKLKQSYGGEQASKSTLAMMERVLVINETAAAWKKEQDNVNQISTGPVDGRPSCEC